ncbi:hypothetical protein AB434_1089 [Heyndrickxia coagulans]|uniref:Uncharacterized protein n=1 Tax=Heyndrickxia coagulans TaxID=1398 RepID=A0AAN0T1M3_HEYCO|nr:hypothetical protein SB48_HM08orf00079 [Heyndrickxia coagulans]AKN53494.1 hypothetical protein AB434_1089 [Heyndrickxia coagulans]
MDWFQAIRLTQFKPHVGTCNESKVENVLKREFDQQKE